VFSLIVFVLIFIPACVGGYIGSKVRRGNRMSVWLTGTTGCLVVFGWGIYETAVSDGGGRTNHFSLLVAGIAGCALIGWTLGMMFGAVVSKS
jgi:hypothetical protein